MLSHMKATSERLRNIYLFSSKMETSSEPHLDVQRGSIAESAEHRRIFVMMLRKTMSVHVK